MSTEASFRSKPLSQLVSTIDAAVKSQSWICHFQKFFLNNPYKFHHPLIQVSRMHVTYFSRSDLLILLEDIVFSLVFSYEISVLKGMTEWKGTFCFQGCAPCHSECLQCHGPGSDSCDEHCRHYVESSRCVKHCSSGYFASQVSQLTIPMSSNRCQPCHSTCNNCTGPTESDCGVCKLYTVFDNFENRHSADVTVCNHDAAIFRGENRWNLNWTLHELCRLFISITLKVRSGKLNCTWYPTAAGGACTSYCYT